MNTTTIANEANLIDAVFAVLCAVPRKRPLSEKTLRARVMSRYPSTRYEELTRVLSRLELESRIVGHYRTGWDSMRFTVA